MAVDMWAWVEKLDEDLREAGQHRIADLLDKIPSAKVEGEAARVEAMLPEALAAARAMKHPWMEVFLRHWGLTNRLTNLAEGEKALPEAAALLEFAHRDETQDCPQSVCVTQDIAICYRNMDGPGWAEECLAVCEETLARVDPLRNCFMCLSEEYALALADSNRADEAVTYVERQTQRMREAGGNPDNLVSMRTIHAHILYCAGRRQEALEALRACDEAGFDGDTSNLRLERQVWIARILAELGHLDEAWEKLPNFDKSITPGLYPTWAAAIETLALGHAERNTWQLGRLLFQMASHLSEGGAHRKCIELALRHARLALDRGACWVATRSLELARQHQPKLRADVGAAASIDAVQTQLDQAQAAPVTLPVPAEQIASYVREHTVSPETDIELLLAACGERPNDGELAIMLAQAMQAAGARTTAIGCLWGYMRGYGHRHDGHTDEEHPDEHAENAAFQLLNLLLEGADAEDQITQLAREIEPTNPAFAHLCRLRLAYQQSRWQSVGEEAARVLQYRPHAQTARRLWAAAAMADGDFARAVALRRELVDMAENPGDDDWDLMTAASAAGDWDTVRHAAARLGLNLDSEQGPIREDRGWAYLAFDEDGETRAYAGRRTGPVTAQVIGVAVPGARQHVRDEVVFDATPLYPAPEDEAERKRWVPTFRVVHVAQHADYRSWFIDGAAPGEARWNALCEAADREGWPLWVISPDDYQVRHPAQNSAGEGNDKDEGDDDEREPLPGCYFLLATPAPVAPAIVDARLREWTADWEHPLCWLKLAREAGADVAHHERIVADYGL